MAENVNEAFLKKWEGEDRKIYLCEADLSEGELRHIKAENQNILLCCYQGKIYAMDAACAHSGYPLSKGQLNEKGILTCPLHYMQIDIRTGKVVSIPPLCENQPIFQIEIEEGKIYWILASQKIDSPEQV